MLNYLANDTKKSFFFVNYNLIGFEYTFSWYNWGVIPFEMKELFAEVVTLSMVGNFAPASGGNSFVDRPLAYHFCRSSRPG